MSVPPITYAFVSTLAFTSLDASLGYLTNVVGISIVQIIMIRTVSPSHGLLLAIDITSADAAA